MVGEVYSSLLAMDKPNFVCFANNKIFKKQK
jgi:hypothetical protein